MAKRGPKRPKSDLAVAATGKKVFASKLVVERDGNLVIRFNRIDLGSRWCLTKISPEDHLTLLSKVRELEKMTVNEVFFQTDGLGTDYDVVRLPTRYALDRLAELELDDEDKISRLRIAGKLRLYGFRQGTHFYALWWDPEHEIWPSSKKHT